MEQRMEIVEIVTFYSHFGAVRYKRFCGQMQIKAQMMPVPRNLSSSCGTCVRCEGKSPVPEPEYLEEIEQIVRVTEKGYECLYRAKDS